jgi:5-methylcytosine-specific restriction endonuclease McrA
MSSVEELIWGRKKKKLRRLTKADKDKILKRQKYKCAGKRCKKDLSKIPVHFDHKKPLALGGSDTLRNYQALCPTCHAIKTREDRSKIAKCKRKRKEEIPLLF